MQFLTHVGLSKDVLGWLPIPVQNLKELSPESVPEDKNTEFTDGGRSGSNKQNETNETV